LSSCSSAQRQRRCGCGARQATEAGLRIKQQDICQAFIALQTTWNEAQQRGDDFNRVKNVTRLDMAFGEIGEQIEAVAGD
jgi:hypothetical protein